MKVSEMEAGPELDALVAEKVMEFNRHGDYCWYDRDDQPTNWGIKDTFRLNAFAPSTDIAAAWQVVERVELLNEAMLERDADGTWWVDDEPTHHIQACAPTAPLAICRAALRKVGVTDV